MVACAKLVDEGLLSQSLFESLDTLKAQLVDATARKEKLTAEVATARSKSQALYSPEALIEAIRNGDPERRLKLKAEIAKRISRLDVDFEVVFHDDGTVVYHERGGAGRFLDLAPHQFGGDPGPVVRVTFVNGADRFVILDGDKAVLLWAK